MASRHDTHTRAASDETTTDAATTHDGSEQPARTETVREYRGTGIMWAGLALVLAIALFVVIALQNTEDVAFEFLWFDFATPLSLILFLTFGIALMIGEVIGFVWRHRRRTRLREREELRRLRSRSD